MNPELLKYLHATRRKKTGKPPVRGVRPRTNYAYNGVALSASEWAAALGLATVHTFYTRISKHLKNPRKYPAHWVYRPGNHRAGPRASNRVAPPVKLRPFTPPGYETPRPAEPRPVELSEAERAEIGAVVGDFLK